MIAGALRLGGLDPRVVRVETEEEMRSAVREGSWDVILLDDVLPEFSARALKICREIGCDAPILVVSGNPGEDLAVATMKEGVDDYLLKKNLTRLPGAVGRAMADAAVRKEKRQMQRELQESRKWLYATLRSAGDAIVASDAAGRIRFMNRVAENLIGCGEVQAIGHDVDEVMHLLDEDGQPLETSPSKIALEETAANSRELVFAGPRGERTPMIATAARILDETSGVIGSVIALRDITERKLAEQQVLRNNNELQQFFHSVGHDLQEPLRSVSIYSELIERNLKDPDQEMLEYLRFVRQGAERMSALLSDLRAYARVSTTSRGQEATESEVALQQVMVNLATSIDACGAAVAHGALPVVAVQGSHLVQLFQNLISNSIKYRRPGHAPTVRIGSSREAGHWQFSVADNGTGIEPENLSRIFDFCQRGHGAEIPGTGMGLAICRRIVQIYGGRIWVESTLGEGSKFYFTLPAPSEQAAPSAPAVLETV